MIVGYSIVKGLRVSSTESIRSGFSGTMDPGEALSTAIGLGGATAMSISGLVHGNVQIKSTKRKVLQATSPGESVWAILYRKIKLRTNIVDSALSSNDRGWTMMLSSRGRAEQTSLIEAELDDAQEDLLRDLSEEIEWEIFGENGDADVFIFTSVDADDEESVGSLDIDEEDS